MVRHNNHLAPQLAEVSVTASPVDGSYRVSCHPKGHGNAVDDANTEPPQQDTDEEDETTVWLVHSGVPAVKNSESSNSNNIASRYPAPLCLSFDLFFDCEILHEAILTTAICHRGNLFC